MVTYEAMVGEQLLAMAPGQWDVEAQDRVLELLRGRMGDDAVATVAIMVRHRRGSSLPTLHTDAPCHAHTRSCVTCWRASE